MFIKGITENMETVWINKRHIVSVYNSDLRVHNEEYYYVRVSVNNHASYYIKKKDLDPILNNDSDELDVMRKLMEESEVKMKMSNFEDIEAYDVPTNGSIFLKTYPDSHVSSIAYDDGVCYVYVDLCGSRIRFTSDWWNATYKEACRTESEEEE